MSSDHPITSQPEPPVLVAPTHAPRPVEAPVVEAELQGIDRQLPVPAGAYQRPEADPDNPHDRYELAKARLRIAEHRVKQSLSRIREAATELQPVGRIRANPVQWVAGGLAFGLFVGWLTAPRRRFD